MKINYPTRKNTDASNHLKEKNKPLSRGMAFENELNLSNEFYRIHNVACIYKKPTPIKIVKVDYPKRSMAKIVEAYYQTPSTTDYNGVYRAKYIDYEAKETVSLSFNFKHIFPHQVEHLKSVDKLGGIAFVIIYFKKLEQVFIIDIKDFYKQYTTESKKSIKADEIESIGGIKVKCGYTPLVDYLTAVDKLYFD